MSLAFPAIHEFDQRHGADGIRVAEMNALVFSDGATRDLQVGAATALMEPPKDAYKRLGIQIAYHSQKLTWALEEFADFKQYLKNAASNAANHGGLLPPATTLDELQKLAQKVHDLKAVVEDLKRQRNETPEAQQRAKQAAAKAEYMQKCGDYQQKLDAIRV